MTHQPSPSASGRPAASGKSSRPKVTVRCCASASRAAAAPAFSTSSTSSTRKAEDDLVIARDSAVVLVDPASVPFLAGSEVDFVDDLIGASFRVVNPNATASCGCGTSFSI